MIKSIKLAIFSVLFSTALVLSIPAEAHQYKVQKYVDLKNQTYFKLNQIKAKLKETKMIKFSAAPQAAKVNQDVTLFFQPLTSFTDSELILDVKLDDESVTSGLERPAEGLWLYDAGQFTENKDHTVEVKVYIQDKNTADLLKEAITSLDLQIISLENQIEEEIDPDIIARLEAEMQDKIEQRNELIQTLADLKSEVTTENFNFEILEDNTLSDYPKITKIEPNVVKALENSQLKITGLNLQNTTQVFVGGQSVTIQSHSATEVIFESPLLNAGVYDIEVKTEVGTIKKNVKSKSALFATSQDVGNPNFPPTAIITSASYDISLGQAISVSGSNSFDPLGKNLSYTWKFVSVPSGSNISTGTIVGTQSTYSNTPIVPGLYVLEMFVKQTTAPFNESSATQAVFKVAAPANRAPTFTTVNLTAVTNQTRTLQLAVNDLDFWQTHGIVVLDQSPLGTASVDANGLLTFIANGTTGSDQIDVFIFDNGSPALSTIGTININVVSSNQIPTVTNVIAFPRNPQSLPVNTILTAVGLTDPDGTITEIKFEPGDGTIEYAPISGPNFGFVIHNYHAYGSYTAKMTAKDNAGGELVRTFTVNVTSNDVPDLKFTLNKYSCTAPCSVTANATGTTDQDGILHYRWLWGDGTAEEVGAGFSTRSHTFNNAGTYRIRLRVRDNLFTQADGFATIYVGTTPPATGSPNNSVVVPLSAREVVANQPVSMDGTKSFDPNPSGGIVSYLWNLGDCVFGSCTSTSGTTSAAYSNLGFHFASVSVTNNAGGVTASSPLLVNVINSGKAPVAIFKTNNVITGGSTVSGVAPFTVHLDSALSYDYDGTLTGREWQFGDGTSTFDVTTTSKTYNTPGLYQIILTVEDNHGNINFVTQNILVNSSARKLNDIGGEDSSDPVLSYAMACAMLDGQSCFEAGKIYQSMNQEFLANEFFSKACGLGLQEACVVR